MLSLSLHTLDNRLSLRRKILAVTEDHLRARRVDSVEWCFDSVSIWCPISPWKDSSRRSVESVRIQFSLPNRQYPRHFTLRWGVKTLSLRTAMGVDSAGLVGDTSNASHFVGFRVRPFSCAKLLTVSICSSSVARELLIVRISSAWINAPAKASPTNGPRAPYFVEISRGDP